MRRALPLLARLPQPGRAAATARAVTTRGLSSSASPDVAPLSERTSPSPLPTEPVPPPADVPTDNDDILTAISAAAGTDVAGGMISYGAQVVLATEAALPALGAAGAIVLCSIGVRLLSSPLLYFHQVHAARAARAGPELASAQAWVRSAPGTLMQNYVSFRRLRAVAFRAADTSGLCQFPWFLAAHVPLVAGLSLGVRAAAAQAPAGWGTVGPFWAADLCAADPTGALPAGTAALWLWNVGAGRAGPPPGAKKEADQTKFPLGDAAERAVVHPARAAQVARILDSRRGSWLPTALQGVVILSFPYILDVPAAVHVLWIANGTLTALQRTALRSDGFRKAIGLPTRADVAAADGPPVLRATAEAMRGAKLQLEYVRDSVLTKFPNRSVDDKLRDDVNRALERELFARRISIRLEAVVRRDGDSGRKYLAVVRKGSA